MLRGSNSGASSALPTLQSDQALLIPKYINRIAGATSSAQARGPRVMIMGDSTDVVSVTGGIVEGWGAYLANILSSTGMLNSNYDGVFASAPALYGEGRLVLGATSWARDATINSILGATAKATTSTDKLVFTPNNQSEGCTVWYVKQPGGGVLSLDAGTFGTVTADTNAAAGVGSLSIANGLQPYNVKWVSGGQVNVIGMESYNTTHPGMTVLNGALGGSNSLDWSDTSTAYAWLNAVVAMAPDLVITGSCVNDMGGSLSNYITQMTKIITTLKAAGIDIIIRTPNPQNPTDGVNNRSIALQDSFVNALRSLAAQYNLPVIDIYALIQSYAIGSALPYNVYTDTWVHLSSTGWGTIANAIARYLLAVSGFGTGGNVANTVGAVFRRVLSYGDITASKGNVVIGAGFGLTVGTAAGAPRVGSGTLSGGTLAVFNSSITANTMIILVSKGTGATNVGALSVSARINSVNFTVLSTNASDSSTFDWMLVERT